MNVQLNTAIATKSATTRHLSGVGGSVRSHCMTSPEQMFQEHLNPALSEGPERKRAKHTAGDFYSDHVKLIPDSS